MLWNVKIAKKVDNNFSECVCVRFFKKTFYRKELISSASLSLKIDVSFLAVREAVFRNVRRILMYIYACFCKISLRFIHYTNAKLDFSRTFPLSLISCHFVPPSFLSISSLIVRKTSWLRATAKLPGYACRWMHRPRLVSIFLLFYWNKIQISKRPVGATREYNSNKNCKYSVVIVM